MTSLPRSGYTLPVFACASALAAYRYLQESPVSEVSVDLIEPPSTVTIEIEQGAKLRENQALAITRSDPGDNLDLTRNTPIWAIAERLITAPSQITILGGEGIGKQKDEAAIYSYAKRLINSNLTRCLAPDEYLQITIILPFGRQLAQRTSNAAFGVVEGLSLLGTSGIAQPLSAPEQLELYQQELLAKAQQFRNLIFCVGENGLDLAVKMGFNPQQILKTANWIGPMLACAGLASIESLLLFGYHGKLLKLAGGIFHTHHDLADGRLEIMTAHLALLGASREIIQQVFRSPTSEAALGLLRQIDAIEGSNWVEQLMGAIAQAIDQRSQNYIRKQTDKKVKVGSILFDGKREIIICSNQATEILEQLKRENVKIEKRDEKLE
ncbi:cobalt-precorrin-5B (C(1))-methyltransferase CbiD [Gloeocapsa sp. PCC 73106]|uniref:cobalt-precorrin-5B (C(1))-methyltransferase CbiD n=1 Tax=Gloeocapsa sp. PCC 73106 TaxID=102232 RepID=UPI0002AC7028|nr:cobalt-precorrin-5B (C(1))-methyltransferase CbiD [Gloeocapsa sp. PCC 73106]ELR96789.1 cobalamin biosynthesis protein CbiD [Gloeocapsa sp. PCC 73106]